ncbi:GDNF-inducible zinc finger protein 1 isoform X1 [Bombus pyrosoma]|uniref:GDNF-inducible zinc finger protein 1 isoform X1 n=1 Tax=Bombus pyrosoma TaxID=396416 RepID=UPI001CB94A2E|nr:GDNF-inducible zinc finger protein 1 isoform X1 [Bombus pyrosoma]
MLSCKAHGCLSNENTKIDGKDISLFCFPQETDRRNEWFKNCQLNENTESDKMLYLCELHFDKTCFTDSMELIPNAVPTIFTKLDEGQRKRKAEDEPRCRSPTIPSIKQKKLDSDSHSPVTSPQSPCNQLENNDKINGEEKMDICSDHEISLNESVDIKPELYQKVTIEKKLYRLTIQIDKIYGKPCPRSKKLKMLAQLTKGSQQFSENMYNINQGNQALEKVRKKEICKEGGCKLKKSIYDSKPAFQCEYCDKYYVMKQSDDQVDKNICNMCHQTFSSSQSLYLHTKTHFVCDMCQTECSSQVTYDKHIRLHVSTDPLHPYKCHQCTETFELKEDVRQHYLIVHPTIQLQNTILQVTAPSLTQQISQREHRCISCNITFRNEQAYRNHINSHKKKEGLRCNIGDSTNNVFPVPNPLTGSQIGILRAVKFSCKVCSMEFDNVGEVDKHTRTHLEKDSEEEHKCNICKKLFKTNIQLNEHLKYHLSRAHSCPVCSKTFINRTTLKIHLKTHGES